MSEAIITIDKFEPVLDRIIIKEVSREKLLGLEELPEGENKKGTLAVIKDTREYIDRTSYGIVVKVGPEVTKYNLKAGDVVTYQSYPQKFGVPIETGEVMPKDKYRFLTQVDILAIIGA